MTEQEQRDFSIDPWEAYKDVIEERDSAIKREYELKEALKHAQGLMTYFGTTGANRPDVLERAKAFIEWVDREIL